MQHRPFLLVALVIGALAAQVSPAQAQNAEAEALFTEGERLEAAGQLAEACDAFEGSNRIEPRAGTLIRLGECREAEGRIAAAWSAYKDALTRVKDPRKREIAEAKVAALEPRLSYLTVLVADESRVDGLEITRNDKPLDPALWNRAAPVDGGTYVIAGRAPGHEAWRTEVKVGAEADKASVEVPRFKVLRDLMPDAGKAKASPAEAPKTFTGKRKAAAALLGVGVLALAGGAVMGAQATSLEADAFDLCPDPAMPCADATAAQEKLDRANGRALLANVGVGVGAAAVVGAVVLWITGKPGEAPSRIGVSPIARPGLSGVDVTVRF